MNEKLSQEVIDRMARELQAIHELVDNLRQDDIEQSLRNARNAFETNTTLQLENMVHNHYYHAGENHLINEVRAILGLPRLYLPGEKERIERQTKDYYSGKQLVIYDCPPLEDSDFALTDGSAKLIVLGEECDTYVVMGTKSARKALLLMRRYERDECGLDADEGCYGAYKDDPSKLEQGKIVWRKPFDADEADYSYYYSWSERDTKNNPKAVDCFIVRW